MPKSRAFTVTYTVSHVQLHRVHVACLIKSLVIILAVCPVPSLLFRKDRWVCVSIEDGQRVKLGSHAGGIFGVSWHLGERFQLVRDPCVDFNGFAGE